MGVGAARPQVSLWGRGRLCCPTVHLTLATVGCVGVGGELDGLRVDKEAQGCDQDVHPT